MESTATTRTTSRRDGTGCFGIEKYTQEPFRVDQSPDAIKTVETRDCKEHVKLNTIYSVEQYIKCPGRITDRLKLLTRGGIPETAANNRGGTSQPPRFASTLPYWDSRCGLSLLFPLHHSSYADMMSEGQVDRPRLISQENCCSYKSYPQFRALHHRP